MTYKIQTSIFLSFEKVQAFQRHTEKHVEAAEVQITAPTGVSIDQKAIHPSLYFSTSLCVCQNSLLFLLISVSIAHVILNATSPILFPQGC